MPRTMFIERSSLVRRQRLTPLLLLLLRSPAAPEALPGCSWTTWTQRQLACTQTRARPALQARPAMVQGGTELPLQLAVLSHACML